MKLNFNFKLKDLEGKDLSNAPIVNKIIGNILISPNFKQGDVMKKFLLAQKIYQNLEIEVDESDFSLIKQACESKDALAPLAQAQILIYLNKVK